MTQDNGQDRSVEVATATPSDSKPECFVIMPISDPEGYEKGHFLHIFRDVFSPACKAAGYRAVRADEVKETNLIHLDVLQRLINSPMVLCDLSSRNPNVLFELGLRQAFDKPVVLVQETDTPRIFDISPLRVTEYRRARIYHEVIEDQLKIAGAITATTRNDISKDGVNSIVKLLALTNAAALPEMQEANRNPILQIVRAEIDSLRQELRRLAPPAPRKYRHVMEEMDEVVDRVSGPYVLTKIPLGNDLVYVRAEMAAMVKRIPPGDWRVHIAEDQNDRIMIVRVANAERDLSYQIPRNLPQHELDRVMEQICDLIQGDSAVAVSAGQGS